MNEGKDHSASKSKTTKNSGDKDKSPYRRSIIPNSELTETPCPICGEKERRFLFEEREFENSSENIFQLHIRKTSDAICRQTDTGTKTTVSSMVI